MFTRLVGRHNGDLHFGQSVDTQQGRQRHLDLAVGSSASSKGLVVVGSRQHFRHVATDSHQGNLLTPSILGSYLAYIGNFPFNRQLALRIDGRRLEGDIRGLQIGTRNFLDGNRTILLTRQHVLLLAIGQRHAVVQQVDREHSPIVDLGRQRDIYRYQCALIIEQQLVLITIHNDAIDVIGLIE